MSDVDEATILDAAVEVVRHRAQRVGVLHWIDKAASVREVLAASKLHILASDAIGERNEVEAERDALRARVAALEAALRDLLDWMSRYPGLMPIEDVEEYYIRRDTARALLADALPPVEDDHA